MAGQPQEAAPCSGQSTSGGAAGEGAGDIKGAAYWGTWHAAHAETTMEWHVAFDSIRDALAPHLACAAVAAGPDGPMVVDVGCGSSTWGVEMLKDLDGGRLLLLDAVPSLIDGLRARHAGDARVRCEVADCRRLEDVGLGPGVAAVVLDKGTLDALQQPEDLQAMLRGMAQLLQRPSGIFVSVSFCTAGRVLLLRRAASELGLQLALRVVPATSLAGEVRLVALMAESFGASAIQGWGNEDALTRQRLDKMLFGSPVREERFVRFENVTLPGNVVEVEQEQLSARLGLNEDATGHVVWPITYSFCAHLCANPDLVRGRRVIELGAGTGLAGFVAAGLGAKEVVLTDLSSTLPLLRSNVGRNSSICDGRVRVAELKWGAELEPDMEGCDVVIGCDIVYQHDEDTSVCLVDTMRRLAGDNGICLIAYEFRDGMLADMEFFDRVNQHFDVEVVSLGLYGFGVNEGDDDPRLLYVYRPHASARGTGA